MNYVIHPNSAKKFPQTLSVAANDGDAIYFALYVPYHLTAISTISLSVDADGLTAGWANVRWMWKSSPTDTSYSTSWAYTNATDLKNNFSASKQILILRYGIESVQARKGTIRGATVTVNGTTLGLATVNVGDPITAANMANLKSYIDTLATDLQVGTTYTIATLTQYTTIDNADWSSYITKANALPHVSGLTQPGANNPANASYYNSIVSALRP